MVKVQHRTINELKESHCDHYFLSVVKSVHAILVHFIHYQQPLFPLLLLRHVYGMQGLYCSSLKVKTSASLDTGEARGMHCTKNTAKLALFYGTVSNNCDRSVYCN